MTYDQLPLLGPASPLAEILTELDWAASFTSGPDAAEATDGVGTAEGEPDGAPLRAASVDSAPLAQVATATATPTAIAVATATATTTVTTTALAATVTPTAIASITPGGRPTLIPATPAMAPLPERGVPQPGLGRSGAVELPRRGAPATPPFFQDQSADPRQRSQFRLVYEGYETELFEKGRPAANVSMRHTRTGASLGFEFPGPATARTASGNAATARIGNMTLKWTQEGVRLKEELTLAERPYADQ
ncbi:MAG: hypothetical protein HW416_342, partial [Chloroflexi bacterium]|nr:hypothetical protein [Chloroflexota bacterium]